MSQLPLFEGRPNITGRAGTFYAAKEEPFHRWYRYLEGFSADFVRGLFQRFMPHATRVLDPFAGTGTTPLTLVEDGVSAFYCEVNPALAFIIETKGEVLRSRDRDRRELADATAALAGALPDLVDAAAIDAALEETYTATFHSAKYFDHATKADVLRLRTVCDAIAQRHPLLGRLATGAVLGQLVTSSLLTRAGDVRYKSPTELAKGIEPMVPGVASNLRRMAADIRGSIRIANAPLLATKNAKALTGTPPLGLQGVITSPPYLNGTNYIRNTKLELWFLREVRSEADLRLLRDQVVTAGINDVVTSKAIGTLPSAVRRVVSDIEASAYDDRIPRMVASYFADMQVVLAALSAHCEPQAVVCIDIGDSRYAGVNVPTPALLSVIAGDFSLEVREHVPLRTRLSKDKTPLSQEVVVLQKALPVRGRRANSPMHGADEWRAKWRVFSQDLPHQREPYSRRNWGNPLHSICSYQGKMKPSLAHFLIHVFSEPGQTVLDPFAGSGTIPFEAALQGRSSIGVDISRLGVVLTSAKINPPERTTVAKIVSQLEQYLTESPPSESEFELASAVRFNRSIPEYYHPKTLAELLSARRFFREVADDSPETCFVLACLLHILHGNRPYALSRRSHPVTPFAPTGPTEYRPLIGRLQAKLTRSLEAPLPHEFTKGVAMHADVCSPFDLKGRRVDAVVTSPPFFDSTRFYMSNWLRYWFCGWERDDFTDKIEPFLEVRQKKSLQVYREVFRSLREHMVPTGLVALHLGLSRKCDMASELTRLAEPAFRVEDTLTESVAHCESHGVRDKGTVTSHQVLVLRPA